MKRWIALVCMVSGSAFAASVADYGAIPNDAINDHTAIMNCINANTDVFFPAGEYWIGDTITVAAGRVLRGPTSGAPAVLRMRFDDGFASSGNSCIIIGGDGVTIRDLVIDNDWTDGTYAQGIYAENRANVTIERVEIKEFSVRYGIHLVECDNFTIKDCYVHSFLMNVGGTNAPDMIQDSPAGIRVTRCNTGLISGCRVYDIEVGPDAWTSVSELVPSYGAQTHQADCITVAECSNVSVVNCDVRNSGELVDFIRGTNCSLINSRLEMGFMLGVKMIGAQGVTVQGNYIADAANGLWAGDHNGVEVGLCVIDGNDFVNCGSPGIWNIEAGTGFRFQYNGVVAGINFNNGTDQMTVTNNNIYDCLGYLDVFMRLGTGNGNVESNTTTTGSGLCADSNGDGVPDHLELSTGIPSVPVGSPVGGAAALGLTMGALALAAAARLRRRPVAD